MPQRTSPLNFVPASPERRHYRLKCRFVIWAGSCHRVVGPRVPRCDHLEKAMYEAGCRFFEAMELQGWESADGRLRIGRGPMPATEIGTSELVRPSRPVTGQGAHPRNVSGDGYVSPVVDNPGLDETDAWEYELWGLFVRPLLPTEGLLSAVSAVERRARRPDVH